MASIDVAEQTTIIPARIQRGQDTYAGRLDAWHMLGIVTGTFQTWREMVEAAKADFYVFKSQLQDGLGRPVDAWGTFRWDLADKAKGDKTASKFLGTVGSDYQVIQHTAGFDLLDALVGQIDGAHYETMGVLDFGRVVWGQVDTSVSIRVGDDVSNILLTFHTSHDGSRAFDIYETSLRVVCRNTLRAGSLNRLAATLRVRHTKSAPARIKGMQAEIQELNKTAMAMQDKLIALSERRVVKDTVKSLFERLFPRPKTEDGTPKESTRRDNILASILERYESNDSNAFPEQRGTALNLLNAVTEWTDHDRGTEPEAAVFGSGDRLKSLSLEWLIDNAGKMPLMPVAQASIPVADFASIGLNVA